MTSYRIEILFVGDAPDSELERAQILASPKVTEAIESLSKALIEAGFSHDVDAKTVRSIPKAPRGSRLQLQTMAEPSTRSAAE